MSDLHQICPVCRLQEATVVPAQDVTLVSCERCGDFHISLEAEEILAQSAAPLPDDYRMSHAFRFATQGHGLPEIGEMEARRLIQRRSSRKAVQHRHFDILRWLSEEEGSDSLTWNGWAAILNDRSPDRAEHRVRRMVGWNLVRAREDKPGLVELEITQIGNELIKRQGDRVRRRDARSRSTKREISPVQSAKSADHFYASSLLISHYKCFGDPQEISFRTEDGRVARWTFLIGENGVGKTTILRLIAGLTPTFESRRSSPVVTLARWIGGDMDPARDADQEFTLEAEFHRGPLGEQLCDPAIFGAVQRDADLDALEISLSLAADSISIGWRSLISYCASYDTIMRTPLVVGYGPSRAVGSFGLAADRERLVATHSLFHPEVPLQDPEDWLLRNDYAARFIKAGDGDVPDANRRLIDALRELLPDVQDFSIFGPDKEHDRPWVGFQTGLGLVDYKSLSTGYQSTIAWIIDLAIRMIEYYPDATNPLDQPAIVLIDEIDIHLHPKWQRSITTHLERLFPNAQFIATTHSPLIIQGTVEANLVLLRSDGRQVRAMNDVDEIRHFRVDQILTSELFDLASARPDEEAALFRRRTEILSAANPQAHGEELAELERQLGIAGSRWMEKVDPKSLALLKRLKS